MIYSRAHISFCHWLNTNEALLAPEKFLGSNWEIVLRFWNYYESLGNAPLIHSHKKGIQFVGAWYLALNAAEEVIGGHNQWAACRALSNVVPVTCELIAAHKLDTLFFLPRFFPDFNCQTDERSRIAYAVNNKQN